MKIINITSSPFTTTSFVHHVKFEVDEEVFEAYIAEDKNETYVKFCFKSIIKYPIDIPVYFGNELAPKVFNLIYNNIKENF